MAIITSPFPAEQNPPIRSDFYVPNFFTISSLTLGQTTSVTTSTAHNFTVGQLIRFKIPNRYRTRELNTQTGYVTSVPTTDSVVVDIDSSSFTTFVASPYVSTITNITQSTPATVTASNSFRLGDLVTFSDVDGMTEINDQSYTVTEAFSSYFVINADTASFTAYSANGTATFSKPYESATISAVGDVNMGAINVDNSDLQLYINGSFRNISPQ